MIRTLPLVCSDCGNKFIPNDELYYRDNFLSTNIKDVHFVCSDCIGKWQAKWQIKAAEFFEKDYVLTVTITLADGTVYRTSTVRHWKQQ